MIEAIGKSPVLASGVTVPLSPAIKAGNLIFVSGQLGLDDNGNVVSEDPAEQTRQTLNRIRAVLQQAGADLDHIVKASIWVTDKADFAAVNRVWAEVFSNRPPARSTVVSELLIPGAKIEVDAIAIVG